jgi:hypothetical protein
VSVKYAWLYFLDSITAPTLWSGIGIGVTFATAICTYFHRVILRKAVVKAASTEHQSWLDASAHRASRTLPSPWRRGLRPQTHVPNASQHAVLDLDGELEMPSHDDVWLHVQHHDDTAAFHLSVVDEARQTTVTYRMTSLQATQLAAWIAKITMPAETLTTHTEDAQ